MSMLVSVRRPNRCVATFDSSTCPSPRKQRKARKKEWGTECACRRKKGVLRRSITRPTLCASPDVTVLFTDADNDGGAGRQLRETAQQCSTVDRQCSSGVAVPNKPPSISDAIARSPASLLTTRAACTVVDLGSGGKEEGGPDCVA